MWSSQIHYWPLDLQPLTPDQQLHKNTWKIGTMWMSLSSWGSHNILRFKKFYLSYSSVQFSHSVVSDSLWPHELQHARPLCPSPTPGVHPNSCPSSQWCHPAISYSVVPFSCPPILPTIRVFSNESTLCMRWPKYWSFSFSISPSIDYSGLCFYFKTQVLTLNPITSELQILCSIVFFRILFNMVSTF